MAERIGWAQFGIGPHCHEETRGSYDLGEDPWFTAPGNISGRCSIDLPLPEQGFAGSAIAVYPHHKETPPG